MQAFLFVDKIVHSPLNLFKLICLCHHQARNHAIPLYSTLVSETLKNYYEKTIIDFTTLSNDVKMIF